YTQVRIVRLGTDEEVAAGEIGEIQAKGPGASGGYLHDGLLSARDAGAMVGGPAPWMPVQARHDRSTTDYRTALDAEPIAASSAPWMPGQARHDRSTTDHRAAPDAGPIAASPAPWMPSQ